VLALKKARSSAEVAVVMLISVVMMSFPVIELRSSGLSRWLNYAPENSCFLVFMLKRSIVFLNRNQISIGKYNRIGGR
jgi:hypothetical protein